MLVWPSLHYSSAVPTAVTDGHGDTGSTDGLAPSAVTHSPAVYNDVAKLRKCSNFTDSHVVDKTTDGLAVCWPSRGLKPSFITRLNQFLTYCMSLDDYVGLGKKGFMPKHLDLPPKRTYDLGDRDRGRGTKPGVQEVIGGQPRKTTSIPLDLGETGAGTLTCGPETGPEKRSFVADSSEPMSREPYQI
ncbi:hypothetical protein PIB30_052661 [Stylosanthes scabra]|uniref:Uncharacterized protein n=1 Tax=Stylosanthes scabra TaxID=79078 RepID=A0ABU6ZH41_9FABA|nr:hypothetical protein [Stylosanthes scabra]